MVPRVLMLGWGFPPNVTGGLDTAIGKLWDAFQARDDLDIELVLPAEYAPEDREGIYGVPTGEGDVITRIGRLSSSFADHASRVDIIHTNDWFGYQPGLRAIEQHDVTWVTTFHSLSSDRNLYPPDREVETEQRIVDRADELLAVSEYTSEKIAREYGGDATVIYNGFSSLEPSGRDIKAELDISGEMLFFVGRHTDQKGISHLIYAMEQLKRRDITLVVGGTGHLTGQLKQFVSLLDIESSVEFVGYIPEADLPDYYASADLFVSPSLSEPFGITIVEALSVDTRVLACRSGVAEILPDDVLITVKPDSREIVEGIERGLAKEGPIEYEYRSWETVAEEHIDFYNKILNDH